MIKLTALIIFIVAIHLAGCDSENWNWFYWSKIVAIGLFGVTVLLGNAIKRAD